MTTRQLLEELASRYGVAVSYSNQAKQTITADDDTLVSILKSLGVSLSPAPTSDELTTALYFEHLNRARRPLPPCVVVPSWEGRKFVVHVPDGEPAEVVFQLEDGTARAARQLPNDTPPTDGWGEATFQIPADLPHGYHQIKLNGGETCPLIVTPARLDNAATPQTGVMAQIYSVRSRGSWGMGDFHDIGLLAETVAHKAGADFLLINPLHAAEPSPPVEDSPYLPTTRRFLNPIYLRIEDVPELTLLDAASRADVADIAAEFQQRNRSADRINRDEIYAAKLHVLRDLYRLDWARERTDAFREFTRREGEYLQRFAEWCADFDATADPDFYAWLQFLCDEQLAAAHRRAKDAGMRTGLITDLAVGVHPAGADAAILSEVLAPDVTVGAPPDPYNQQGQDWSQPPWHPTRLAETGYRPWSDMLRAVLRHAGGVRVDHILGLFRLFWIPRGGTPRTGTYVHYDFEAMLGILALEAERAGALFIGEDLGTTEPWVRQYLADKGVFGTSVVWFERTADKEHALPREQYRRLSMASVGTHDLPPTLAYVRGSHNELRHRLGVLDCSLDDAVAADRAWQERVFSEVGAVDGDDTDKMAALHEYGAGSPALLTCTSLVDLVGDVQTQNQPGTTVSVYPNWQLPLCNSDGEPVLIEDLGADPLFSKIASAASR